MNVCHIIGCGTIGSNLAFAICKSRMFQEIHVYDDDFVSFSDQPVFPYTSDSMGLPKVSALSLVVELVRGDNIEFVEHRIRVKNGIIGAQFVIDCRDRKYERVQSDMRLSMDGPVLIIDCRDEYPDIDDYHEYVMDNDYAFIDLGIAIVINYIFRMKYVTKTMTIFNMNRVLQTGDIIDV